MGYYALFYNIDGFENVAIGESTLSNNRSGSYNVACGSEALVQNTTGNYNTASGYQALQDNDTGSNNTASGTDALRSNTTGSNNTADGFLALINNFDGINNTATGSYSLSLNNDGGDNTATGFQAMYFNQAGNSNTAVGSNALYTATSASRNTAMGFQSLYSATSGGSNTTVGYQSLKADTTGAFNVALGFRALAQNTHGDFNVALGTSAGRNLTSGSYNIDIGNTGMAGEAATIRVGAVGTQTNAYLAGVSGVTVASGVPVIVDADGHLGTMTSSERFKEAITPMDRSSEDILELEPVSFRYKSEYDPAAIPQFGLIAEQVAKVDPALVARDAQGKIYTVRYEAVNAMLLNEFLKEHRKVEAQQGTIDQLRAGLEAQQRGIARPRRSGPRPGRAADYRRRAALKNGGPGTARLLRRGKRSAAFALKKPGTGLLMVRAHKPKPIPTPTPADRREAAAEEALTADCVRSLRRPSPTSCRRPPAPPPRRGETAAHLLLKRLALFWAQKQGYHSCAYEVSLPNCRYRADLAAYMPSKGKVKVRAHDPAMPALTHRVMVCHTLGSTAVFECKQARSDFLKDSRSTRETLAGIERPPRPPRRTRTHAAGALSVVARRAIRSSRTTRATTSANWSTRTYKKVLARITLLQNRLYQQTKFDTLVRYRCGNLFYVVAEDGIFQPHEIPLHWGLLVRRADRLELREKPVWQNLDDHERLALLHKIAASGTRALNREAGITFEQIWEARRLGG